MKRFFLKYAPIIVPIIIIISLVAFTYSFLFLLLIVKALTDWLPFDSNLEAIFGVGVMIVFILSVLKLISVLIPSEQETRLENVRNRFFP